MRNPKDARIEAVIFVQRDGKRLALASSQNIGSAQVKTGGFGHPVGQGRKPLCCQMIAQVDLDIPRKGRGSASDGCHFGTCAGKGAGKHG